MTDKEKKSARTVGALFLISNVTFLVGAIVLIEPYLSAPDYLVQVSENGTQIILGALLEFINGLAYIGIAVLMYPIFRKRFESMALGYVALRIIEFVTQIAASIGPLLLLTLSEEFVRAGAPESSSFQALGAFSLAVRYWSFEMLYLVFCLSALMFYYMLYQTRLVPRFISLWGLIGAALVLANSLLEIFGIGLGTGIGMVFGLPMLLNELFLGVWLMVKGFSATAIVSDSGKAVINQGQLSAS